MLHLAKLLSKSPEHTFETGRRIGRCLEPGDVVALTGSLGSGKSVLARGIMRELGVSVDIPSPSFVIVAVYRGRMEVNHIDLYRLRTADEVWSLGIEEVLFSDGVSVVEWAEKAQGLLPSSRLEVAIDFRKEPDRRVITLRPSDSRLGARLVSLARALMHGSVYDDPRG